MSNPVLVNLSFLFSQPTGISTYAANLFPYLKPLDPTLLISPLAAQHWSVASNYSCYPVPPNLTPQQGTKGHFRRLLWTQFQLPRLSHKLRSPLLFSPLPEAPLYANCRYIVTVHDLIPLRFPRRYSPLTPYFRHYIPQVLAQAQHVICDSQSTARDITDFFQIPAAKITPILLAHDANHFCLEVVERLRQKGSELTSGKHPYFLYIGRHDPYKNLHRLIDAFAALPNSGKAELWIAGPPDRRYTPLLQVHAEQLNLSNRVKFLNYLPYEELPLIIHRAIALVFPSLWEGFGLPVLEAMACGTPVITSNLSSLPEVAGDAALLVNPYDTGELTKAMGAVAEDTTLRSHLSALGLNRARQFSWAKTGCATVEAIERYL